MENYQVSLDTFFHALADPTRRAVIQRLGKGKATVSELAAPHEMALPSFLKHLHVLEDSGLIASRKDGRVRTCRIVPETFAAAEGWLEEQRRLWEARTDRLQSYVEQWNSQEEM